MQFEETCEVARVSERVSDTLWLCLWRDQPAGDRSCERGGQELGSAGNPHGQFKPREAAYIRPLGSASNQECGIGWEW